MKDINIMLCGTYCDISEAIDSQVDVLIIDEVQKFPKRFMDAINTSKIKRVV